MKAVLAASLLGLTSLPAAVAQQTAGAGAAPNLAVRTVDAMNKVWGAHPGMRANHAKGVVVMGSFTPSAAGTALSTAVLFSGGTIPVTVRFSDSTGVPDLPDGSPNANPHGMAIKFFLSNGEKMDVVTNSLKFFPVATGEDFLAMLNAIYASGPTAPKPTPLDNFIASHPQMPKAFGSVQTPTSFARETYNGVDAFVFVDAKGKRQPFRFEIVPVGGPAHLGMAAANAEKPDFLVDELPARLAKHHVKFYLMAQLAAPGDQTKDPSMPWPADRKLVNLGTITLTAAAADSAKAEKTLLFIPGHLTPGIMVSDDPLIEARDQAYGVSFSRRIQSQ